MDDIIRILIDYEMLFNADYGIINLLVTKFNSSYLNTDYLRKVKYDQLMKDLINQEKDDPLKLAFKDGVDYTEIYNELQTKYEESIVQLSSRTLFFGYIKELFRMKNDEITITIVCKNKYEEQKIKNSFPTTNIVYYDSLDIDNYDVIYCKSYKNLTKLGGMKRKHIYMGNYNYNIKDISDDIKTIILTNEVEMIQVY